MSEEMKNLNEQPEENKAPVEKKEEAPKLPLDKKTIAIICGAVAAVLVVVLVLVLTLGGGNDPHSHNFVEGKCECGESDPNYVPPHVHNYVEGKCECGATDPNYVPPVVEQEYTLGMGVVFGEIKNNETSATIATVVLDKDGKIVDCKIDVVQNKYTVDSGVVFSNLLTKMEQGDDYGMSAAVNYGMDWNGDGVVKEWYEQAKAFEAYVIGKTASEVEAMATQTLPSGYIISDDDALLAAGCTIQITDFKAAVVKACNDDQGVSFKALPDSFTLGVAANSEDDGSSVEDGVATIKMNVDIAAVVLADGKIVAALNDAIQPQLKIENEEVTSTSVGKGEGILKTKRELLGDYGMSAAVNYGMDWNGDGVVKEWYEQSAAFSKHVVGMTVAEVKAMATQTLPSGYIISADDELLSAGCTIQITGIKAVVAEAANNAGEEAEYTLGMGVVFGELKNNETSATIATVVLDKDGKIVACRIDVVQNKYNVGEIVEFKNLLTKMEQGDDYGMSAAVNYGMDWNGDGVVKEWYEQAKAFEAYVIGKTASEVEAMATQTLPSGYIISDDDALLAAGCTIQITDFKAAVVKACNDDQGVSFKALPDSFTLGVAANSEDDGSSVEDGVATIKMNVDIAAVVLADGKIVAALNDAIQPQLKIENEEVTSTSVGKGEGILKTKRELLGDYGMSAAVNYGMDWNGDGVVKEWYEQSAAFSKHVVGMTVAEVKAMATQTLPSGYIISADDELLSAGCTIQITGIKAVVAESVNNAR